VWVGKRPGHPASGGQRALGLARKIIPASAGSTLMKPHIRRYLDSAERWLRNRHPHIVRSSADQCPTVPFGKWAKHLVSEKDVLLDFFSSEPIRIILNNIKVDPFDPKHYKWHFVDYDGEKKVCSSGYEALFATHLKSNSIPFEYQKWMFARRPTKSERCKRRLTLVSGGGFKENARRWFGITMNGFLYFPDFYLPQTNEFVELKGWPQEPGQADVVRYLQRRGYRIRVLMWEELRTLLGCPTLSYAACLYRAKQLVNPYFDAFANPDWVKKTLSIPSRAWRS